MTRLDELTSDDPGVIWAAGFLEGDGYFTERANGRMMIGAGQVNREPLDRLAEIFEAGRIYFRKQDPSVRRSWWGWEVSKKSEVLRITELVLPWLTHDRRERIPWLSRVT